MAGFAALLIGASDYEQRGITPLPFVRGDLERLGEALTARGVRVVTPRPRGQVSANFVNGEVSDFLRQARSGDSLLICLTGHGLHANGHDYLIPEDLHPAVTPLWRGCVAIDWRQEVENTRAAQVLFLIDACREGVQQDTMGAVGWASGKALAVAGRKVAHLYACSPGQVALFVGARRSSPEGSFSLFSRAVRDVLAEHPAPLDLEQLRIATQDRIDRLHRDHAKPGPPQRIRVLTDVDQTAFQVAGPLLIEPPPPVAELTAAVGEVRSMAPDLAAPPAPSDPRELLAAALLDVLGYGRTERLAQFAAVGPAGDLVELGLQLRPEVVEVMWAAAARARPVDGLVELAGLLWDRGQRSAGEQLVVAAVQLRAAEELFAALDAAVGEPGHRLRAVALDGLLRLPAHQLAQSIRGLREAGRAETVELALSGPRTVEELPDLLAALVAAGLHAEAERLLAEAARDCAAEEIDFLLRSLPEDGAAGRTGVVGALATGALDRLVRWAALRGPDDPGAFVASVLGAAVRQRNDLPALLIALREGAGPEQVQAARLVCAGLEAVRLEALVGQLLELGETAEAGELVAFGLTSFRPVEAARLAAALYAGGQAEQAGSLLAALAGADVPEMGAFLQEAGQGALLDAAVERLADTLAPERVADLVADLRGRQLLSLAEILRGAVLWRRPAAELLILLATAREEDRPGLVERIGALPHPAEDLATLIAMPGHPELQAAYGPAMAHAAIPAHRGEARTEVLGELFARQGDAADLMMRQLAESGPGSDHLRVVLWLADHGHPARATELVQYAGTTRGPEKAAELALGLLTSRYPDLGRRLLVRFAQDASGSDVVRLAETLGHHRIGPVPEAIADPEGYRETAREGHALLQRHAGQRGVPAFADLLLAVDSWWGDHDVQIGVSRDQWLAAPLDPTLLLRAFLAARQVSEAGTLLELLATGGTVGPVLAPAVWTHAAALFKAARLSQRPAHVAYLLTAFGGVPPRRFPALQRVLVELRADDGTVDAARILEQVARRESVEDLGALLLYLHRRLTHVADFAAVSRIAAERPNDQVARIVASLREEPRAQAAFLLAYAVTVTWDRSRKLMVSLAAQGQSELATTLLRAAPWNRTPVALADLLTELAPALADTRQSEPVPLLAAVVDGQELEVVAALVAAGADLRPRELALTGIARSAKVVSLWELMLARGWYGDAARLTTLVESGPGADPAHWYEDLVASGVEVDAAEFLRAAGAGGTPPDLLRGAHSYAARAAAAMFRPPEDVAVMLAVVADIHHRVPEVSGVLALARPVPELAEILHLAASGRGRPALPLVLSTAIDRRRMRRVVDLVEEAGRPERAGLREELATAVLEGRGAPVNLTAVWDAGHRKTVLDLADAMVAAPARLVDPLAVYLTAGWIPPEAAEPLVDTYCLRRTPADVAALLLSLQKQPADALVSRGLMVLAVLRKPELGSYEGELARHPGGRQLAARLRAVTRDLAEDGPPPEPGRWRFWRREE
ncbi:caspase family protein [Kitasatospora sp. NPDC049285]|uniref:caspase family protein n=1 Tax=Kitasatospora sp. NPDC049285 TaxID=3157096 RepID=UPI0034394105